jgi:hypothetical protein
MLIKVLSSIASFFSNTRYKAVFIPCLVVVLALTGLTTVALFHESDTKTPSASANRSENGQGQTPSAKSPQVTGGNTRTFSDDQSVSSEPTAPTATPTPAPSSNPQNTGSTPVAASLEVNLSTATISLKADSSSNLLTASAGGTGNITWTTTLDTPDAGVNITSEPVREGSADFQFRVRTSNTAAPGTYQLTITAKDATRNLSASKTLTVTITQ